MEQRDPIMQYFEWEYPARQMEPFERAVRELAEKVHAELPRNPERTMALRKLLEAKDCLVRAALSAS